MKIFLRILFSLFLVQSMVQSMPSASTAFAWTYLKDSIDLTSTKTRTRCGEVAAKNAAKDAVYEDLDQQCKNHVSESHCRNVCEDENMRYTGQGLWSSTQYTELLKEKLDGCGFLKFNWKRKWKGNQACGCYCYVP